MHLINLLINPTLEFINYFNAGSDQGGVSYERWFELRGPS